MNDEQTKTTGARIELDEITGTGQGAARWESGDGVPCVVIISGRPLGRKIPVRADVTFGRDPEATVQLRDARVSRVHLRIRVEGKNFYVEDLDSRNGTLVNGERIRDERELHFGDRVQIGSTLLLFTDSNVEYRIDETGVRQKGGRVEQFEIDSLLQRVAAVANLSNTILSSNRAAEAVFDDLWAGYVQASFRLGDHLEHDKVDVSAVLAEMLPMMHRIAPRNVHLEETVRARLWIRGTTMLVRRLMLALYSNALDGLPRGGEVSIDARKVRFSGPGTPKDMVLVRITDNRASFDESRRLHMFDDSRPLFKNKESPARANVLGIIDDLGAKLEIDEEVGGGVTVKVAIPALRSPRRDHTPVETRAMSQSASIPPIDFDDEDTNIR